jgi:hypothetical protein
MSTRRTSIGVAITISMFLTAWFLVPPPKPAESAPPNCGSKCGPNTHVCDCNNGNDPHCGGQCQTNGQGWQCAGYIRHDCPNPVTRGSDIGGSIVDAAYVLCNNTYQCKTNPLGGVLNQCCTGANPPICEAMVSEAGNDCLGDTCTTCMLGTNDPHYAQTCVVTGSCEGG